MTLLFIGVLLWIAPHYFKRVTPDLRASMGDKGKLVVTLLLVLSIVLMVLGYRAADFVDVWTPPSWAVHINNTLMVIALYLTSPGPKKGAIFYKLRHPMLLGFGLWAIAHLLVNGDQASILLFGGMLFWAVSQAMLINRAEPDWTPNPKGRIVKDIMFLAISVLLLGVIGYVHSLIGPSPFPG